MGSTHGDWRRVTVPTFNEDWEWQKRTSHHASEIMKAFLFKSFEVRLDDPSQEDDWKRNTDHVLNYNLPIPGGARLSRRVRREGKYKSRYGSEFTIRLDRPSGARVEMAKLKDGWGDLQLYGFAPADGSEPDLRYSQWFIGDLNILRRYLAEGCWYTVRENRDNSSRLAAVHINDLPEKFILMEESVPPRDYSGKFVQCRSCWWPCAGPLHRDLERIDPRFRHCLNCGFKWRAGWSVPPVPRNELQR